MIVRITIVLPHTVGYMELTTNIQCRSLEFHLKNYRTPSIVVYIEK
jgi:hypothetical protein